MRLGEDKTSPGVVAGVERSSEISSVLRRATQLAGQSGAGALTVDDIRAALRGERVSATAPGVVARRHPAPRRSGDDRHRAPRMTGEVIALLEAADAAAARRGARSTGLGDLDAALRSLEPALDGAPAGEPLAPDLPELLLLPISHPPAAPPAGRAVAVEPSSHDPPACTEIDQLAAALLRARHPHALLVGPDDVEPLRIVEELAAGIARDGTPAALVDAVFLRLETIALLDRSARHGGAGRRLERVIDTAAAHGRPPVLVIDRLHLLLADESSRLMLLQCVERSTVRCVGLLDEAHHDRALTVAPEVSAAFRAIHVGEPSRGRTEALLLEDRPGLEQHHEVVIAPGAVDAAVRLGAAHFADRALPGIARELLDEAAATCRRDAHLHHSAAGALRANALDRTPTVERMHVAAVVRTRKRLPGPLVDATAETALDDLRARLSTMVVGQDRAIAEVVETLRGVQAGIADPERPIGSFLLVGPTGVGKTELARSLAAVLFGGRDSLIKLDMVNYQEAHSIARLIGAPPGYVGYAREGELTGRLRRRPYSVILLDEIEKAHRDVFHVLMPLLDEGRLVDSQGRTVDARHAVLMLTSNIGSRHIADEDLLPEHIRDRVRREIANVLPPEFLTRIDAVLTFDRLGARARAAVVRLQLDRLRERLAEQDIEIEVEHSAVDWLAEHGHDPVYGARPLKRAIRRHVEGLVADALLRGELRGGMAVTVHHEEGDDDLALRCSGTSGDTDGAGTHAGRRP